MRVSLLTGGSEKHYQLNLLSALIKEGLIVEFIGNNEMEFAGKGLLQNSNVLFYNLRGSQDINASIFSKIIRVVIYYLKLIKYAYKTKNILFHIQKENKFTFFDRTILNAYFKFLGKKIILTAHDLNEIDRKNSILGNISFRIRYKIANQIIVHTHLMKEQLVLKFQVPKEKITVIHHGINDWVKISRMSSKEARTRIRIIR